jgi:2-methylcitrate dehydratase
MKTAARRLAEIVRDIRVERLGSEVIQEAKRRLLDAIGCGVGGFSADPSIIVRKVANDIGGRTESTIWGQSERTSCEKAALANSTMLRALDFMDSHAGRDACHPCFNIPPCLAVAERVDASGLDLIAAIVAGYEIQIRFQDACTVGPGGWFSGMYLEFSVPLAVGRLLDLNIDQLTQAVAVSASHGNTLGAQSVGSIPASKSVADGMVSATAIMATLLAQRGLTGPEDIIESEAGFAKSIAETLELDRLLAPIAGYKIMEVNTKWYNTVRIAQTAVTGVLGLMEKQDLTWQDIESVTIFLPTGEHENHIGVWDSSARLRPKNRDSANHSPIYSVAVAVVDRVLGPEQYANAKLNDPKVHSVIDRITLQPDSALDPFWPAASITRVMLTTKGGVMLEATTPYPPGHHKNRVSDDQLQQKFRRLAAPVLNAERQDALIDAIDRLENLPSVNALTCQLRGTPDPQSGPAR